MKRVRCTGARAIRPYVLRLEFDDGSVGELDLADHLDQGIFRQLSDYDMFKQVQIDRIGGAEWPNGASLAPEYLASLPRHHASRRPAHA